MWPIYEFWYCYNVCINVWYIGKKNTSRYHRIAIGFTSFPHTLILCEEINTRYLADAWISLTHFQDKLAYTVIRKCVIRYRAIPLIARYSYDAFSYYAIKVPRIARIFPHLTRAFHTFYFCAVKFIMICKVHISFACLCTCVDLCYYKTTLFYSICVLTSVGLILFLKNII